MRIDSHSVVYFVNEKYGTVMRADGALKRIWAWDKEKGEFSERLGLVEASFLARNDQYCGRWCAAHPTRNYLVALAAAARLVPMDIPGRKEQESVKAAKLAARKRELREIGCEAMLARDRADHAEREVLDGNKAI